MKQLTFKLPRDDAWRSSETALRTMTRKLVKAGAGPGVVVRFSGRVPFVADAITLVDVAAFVGADGVVLPCHIQRGVRQAQVRARGKKWGISVTIVGAGQS